MKKKQLVKETPKKSKQKSQQLMQKYLMSSTAKTKKFSSHQKLSSDQVTLVPN